jgi:hypothetical protein
MCMKYVTLWYQISYNFWYNIHLYQIYCDFENHLVDSMILYVIHYDIIIYDIHQLNKLIFLLTDEVFTF